MHEYHALHKIIIRTPTLSFQTANKLTNKIDTDESFLKDLLESKVVQEAIFIASPELYEQLMKLLRQSTIPEMDNKLILSLFRYIIRMSTRSTPFGLFASISNGRLSKQKISNIVLKDEYIKRVRFDMSILCAILENLNQNLLIQEGCNFHRNSSLYKVFNHYRYYQYGSETNQDGYNVMYLEGSEINNKILDKSRKGCKRQDILHLLLEEGFSLEESTAYINDMIANQLLVSDIHPGLTGVNFFDSILFRLKSIISIIEAAKSELSLALKEGLKELHIQLKDLNKINELIQNVNKKKIGQSTKHYYNIISEVEKLDIKFNKKHVFQLDLFRETNNCEVNSDIVESVLNCVSLLQSMSMHEGKTRLESFRDRFINRYETQEIPILKALDPEMGIGYLNTELYDSSSLIDGLSIDNPSRQSQLNWNQSKAKLLELCCNAIRQQDKYIELSEISKQEFNYQNSYYDTFSVVLRHLGLKDMKDKWQFVGIIGSSAGNYIARFCGLNNNIDEIMKEIVCEEEKLHKDQIIAEIIHLPNSRTGNVLLRPPIRKHEIPILIEYKPCDRLKVPLDDLFIRVDGDRILLWSKKLNKEIIPKLTCAHNFSNNSLPIYNFLCDLQSQDNKMPYSFNWGPIYSNFKFLPRVEFKNIVISPATWIIKKREVSHLFDTVGKDKILKGFNKWRMERKINSKVIFSEGDNELYLNLKNFMCIQTFLHLVKKKDKSTIKEFLYDPDALIVRDIHGDGYLNEIILNFVKKPQA